MNWNEAHPVWDQVKASESKWQQVTWSTYTHLMIFSCLKQKPTVSTTLLALLTAFKITQMTVFALLAPLGLVFLTALNTMEYTEKKIARKVSVQLFQPCLPCWYQQHERWSGLGGCGKAALPKDVNNEEFQDTPRKTIDNVLCWWYTGSKSDHDYGLMCWTGPICSRPSVGVAVCPQNSTEPNSSRSDLRHWRTMTPIINIREEKVQDVDTVRLTAAKLALSNQIVKFQVCNHPAGNFSTAS